MSGSGVHKSKLVGVSMLLLSLLLTVSVASLIYLAVVRVDYGRQFTTTDETVKAEITVKINHQDVSIY